MNTSEVFEDKIKEQYQIIEKMQKVIFEMVDELHWETRTDHHALVVKALRAAGVTDDDIRGFFSGNIILG